MDVHHIAFRTRDVPKLVAFYTEVFGLPVTKTFDGRSAWLGLGAAILMLEEASDDEPCIPHGSLECLALRVTKEEREAFTARLQARGITEDGATAFTTYVRDPDGRRVAVSCY